MRRASALDTEELMSDFGLWFGGKRRVVVGGAVAAMAGLALVFSVGVASAAPTTVAGSASTVAGPVAGAAGPGLIGLLSCDDLARAETLVQQWTQVLGADVGTPGSTLWVQAELQKANDAGNTKRVDRLQKILDSRTAHPDRWEKVLKRLQTAQTRRCS
jgi:hypothetical protein